MKSQRILDKLPVRRDTAAHHVDMVDALDGGPTPRKLLRLIEEFWTQVWRSHVLLHVVIDLHQMPIGIVELVSSAMADIPIDPAFPTADCLKGLHPTHERLTAPRAEAYSA